MYALYILHIYTYILSINEVFLDRRMTILHFFLHILSIFIDHGFFLLIMSMYSFKLPAYSAYLQYDAAFFLHILTLFIIDHG
jgi:hypothetical protein